MKEIYSEEILKKEKKQIINKLIILFSFSLIFVSLIIVLLIFAKKEFRFLFIVIFSIVLFLFISFISIFIFYVRYLFIIYKQHKHIYESKRIYFSGEIKEISKNFTIVKNIEGYELLLTNESIIYVDLNFVKEDEFNEGDYIEGYISLNFLSSYSKKKGEN